MRSGRRHFLVLRQAVGDRQPGLLRTVQMWDSGWKTLGSSREPAVTLVVPADGRCVNTDVPQAGQKPRSRSGDECAVA